MRNRIHLLDALRGFCIILMLGYHFGVTLILFDIAPNSLIYNPLLNLLQPIFGGLFIFISGISSNFSRSNLKRGTQLLFIAYGLSVVTYFVGYPIYFGILHFLAVAMLVYGLGEQLFARFISADTIENRTSAARCTKSYVIFALIYAAVFLALFPLFPRYMDTDAILFLPLGFYGGLRGEDYFPILPWLFLFLSGTQLGAVIKAGKFPTWFYRFNMPILPQIGRKSLIIYLAHQPVFFGVLWLVTL